MSRWKDDRGGSLDPWWGVAIFAVVLIVLVSLVGCSRAPATGVVHDRRYTEAYDVYTPQCVSYRKDMSCAISVPHYTHYDASCDLDIYASKDDHGWVEVPCTSYEKYQVGSHYGTSTEGTF